MAEASVPQFDEIRRQITRGESFRDIRPNTTVKVCVLTASQAGGLYEIGTLAEWQAKYYGGLSAADLKNLATAIRTNYDYAKNINASVSRSAVDAQGNPVKVAFTNAEKAIIKEQVVKLWDDATNLTFEFVEDPALADIRIGINAVQAPGTHPNNQPFSINFVPGDGRTDSGYVGPRRPNDVFLTGFDAERGLDARSINTLAHEFGHTLGLSHAAGAPLPDGTPDGNLSREYDTQQWSLLGYKSNPDGPQLCLTPMLMDAVGLEALQMLRTDLNEGNTEHIVDVPNGAKLILDSNGTDTLAAKYKDFQGNTKISELSATIDLRATDFNTGTAYFSSIPTVGSNVNNVAIYKGVEIENARGGSGNDTIIGNDVDNRLEGGLGSDKLEGGLGTDTYRFVKAAVTGWGADVITDNGGQGRILVADSAEQVGLQLVGGKRPNDLIKSAWNSDDKKYLYRFIPKVPGGTPGTTGGTVIITRTDVSLQNESITIQNWSQGQLGINLGPEPALTLLPSEIHVASGDLVAPDTVTYPSGEVRYTQDIATVAAPDNDDVMYSADYRSAPLLQSANLMSAAMSTPDYKRVELHGLGGNDVLWGDAGQDLLDGGAGNDLLVGGQGLNSLIGGEGNDVILTAFTPVGGRPDPRWGPNDDWTAPAGASSVIAEGANWGVYSDAQGEMHISMLNWFYRPGAPEGSPAYHRYNDMDRVWWSAYPEGVDPLDISQESWVMETDADGGSSDLQLQR